MITRRDILAMLAASPTCGGQGVSSRGVKPLQRGKPSGRLFVARFTDIAQQAGMGVGVGDFNLDGSLDLFKTHFADDTNVLYFNDGKGHFDDVSIRAGLGVETRYVGWGRASWTWITTAFPICS
jgi:hypothetical protein